MRIRLSDEAALDLEYHWITNDDSFDDIDVYYQKLGWDLQSHDILKDSPIRPVPLPQFYYTLPDTQVMFFLLKYC